jgi:hypothetical protein
MTAFPHPNALYRHLLSLHGECAIEIKVHYDEQGKKRPFGCRPHLTQAQIENELGIMGGGTLSFYMQHLPGVVVIDFDQKTGLEDCALWKLCIERNLLRTETRGGHHIWITGCDVPPETDEVDVHADIKLDVIHSKRNVWETKSRKFVGLLQDLSWDELKTHLDPSKLTRGRKSTGGTMRGTRQELIERCCGTLAPLPVEIEKWVQAHWSPRSVCNDVQTRQKKRRCGERTVLTEQQVTVTSIKTTDGAEIVMERSENGTITVHVRNTQIGEDGISGLLKLISPDCCRDDWLRVGSFLKHQTMCDGWPLWRDWSQRSEQCSPKLLYEWKNLGSGNECTLGTLIYLALQSNAEAARAVLRSADSESVDRTDEALHYDGCQEWNSRVAMIESEGTYIYEAPGQNPVQIPRDNAMTNVMLRYSKLPLQQWLTHPECRRFFDIGFFPHVQPTPKQLPPTTYNLFRGFSIPREKALAGDVEPLLRHVRDVLCSGIESHSEYLFNCLAQMVQTPWRRLNTAIVMQSREGAGKSLLFSAFMGKIIGPQCFLSESKPSALFGSFNSVLSSRVLCVCEELVWAGSKKDSSVMKDLLTSDTLQVNAKYQQPRTEKSFLNLVILTNSEWAVQASMDARRYFVLQPSDKFTGVQTAESKAYFDKVLAVDPTAFAHWLYARDLTGFNSRQSPQTAALNAQKQQSMNAVESMLFECLQRGYILRDYGWSLLHVNALPRSSMLTRLSQEFGTVRDWPSSPQQFWYSLRDALTAKDGACLLQDLYRGCSRNPDPAHVTAVDAHPIRDRWVSLPDLQTCRDWWCSNKFKESWGSPT